jgi:hypothetical protein
MELGRHGHPPREMELGCIQLRVGQLDVTTLVSNAVFSSAENKKQNEKKVTKQNKPSPVASRPIGDNGPTRHHRTDWADGRVPHQSILMHEVAN